MFRQHPLVTLESILLIAIGGAIGANMRYLVGNIITGLAGTFIANVIGCYLLGFLIYEQEYTDLLTDRSRLVFATGFLSSFTTYSTFALEIFQSSLMFGIGYALISYAIGFTAVLGGRTTANQLISTSSEVSEN